MIEEEMIAWTDLLGKLNFTSGIVTLYAAPKISSKFAAKINKMRSERDATRLLRHHYEKYAKSKKERLEYMGCLTVAVHERKHWHDMCGTTQGFLTHYLYLNQISRQIMGIRNIAYNKKKITTPLVHYFDGLLSGNHRSEYKEHQKILSNHYKKAFSPVIKNFKDVRSYKESDFEHWLDATFFDDGGNGFLNKVPINGLSLFEASAVLAELTGVYDLLTEEAFDLYLTERYKGPAYWVYNGLINKMIEVIKQVNMPLMMTVLSTSMNYPMTGTAEEVDPCARFKILINSLLETKTPPNTLQEIEAWIVSVTCSRGWKNHIDVANEVLEICNNTLSEAGSVSDPFELDFFEGYLLYYMKSVKYFFDKYKENMLYWTSSYFVDSDVPNPPVTTLDEAEFGNWNLGPEKIMAQRWISGIALLDNIFKKNSKEFLCPSKRAGNCKLMNDICGTLPFPHPESEPLLHPECLLYITACELQAPVWNL